MNETFTSVALFYAALKNFFVATLGWTVEREISRTDVILVNGAGVFLRLKKTTNVDTHAIGVEFGTNPDALALSSKDAELWFPFDVSAGGVFQGSAHSFGDGERIDIMVIASGERWSKRYRSGLNVSTLFGDVVHQDHLNATTEPNFKERGGTYIQAGA